MEEKKATKSETRSDQIPHSPHQPKPRSSDKQVGAFRRFVAKAITAAALTGLPAVGISNDIVTNKPSLIEVENSKINETLKTIRDDLYEIEQLSAQGNIHSSEISRKLNNLFISITQLDERRKKLLYKTELKPDEPEEFASMQNYAHEIVNVRTLVEKLKSAGSIDKPTALATGDINYLVNRRTTLSISHEEIFNAIGESQFTLHELKEKRNFEKLSELVLRDEEIDQILRSDKYSGFKNPELFFVLLAYGKLTPNQKILIYRKLLEFPITEYYEVFILVLSELELSKNVREAFMEKLTEFSNNLNILIEDRDTYLNESTSKEYDEERTSNIADEKRYQIDKQARKIVMGGGFYEGDYRDLASSLYEINPLESIQLTKEDKQKIAGIMIRAGSALDCKKMLEHYTEYIDEEMRDIAQKKAAELSNDGIPSFYDVPIESLRGKKINVVVHPYFNVQVALYGIDVKTVDQKTVETAAINSMKKAIEEKGASSNVPGGYINALKTVQETEYYKKLAEDEESITIFILPKGKNPNIFKGIDNQKRNLYYLETSHSNAGNMKAWDIDFLNKVLPNDTQINISGQNLGLCLGTGIGFLNGLKPARRISLDYSGSYEDWLYTDLENNWPNITLPDSPDGVNSLQDVKIILEQNDSFNQYYEQDKYTRWQERWNKGKTTRPEYFIAHRP